MARGRPSKLGATRAAPVISFRLPVWARRDFEAAAASVGVTPHELARRRALLQADGVATAPAPETGNVSTPTEPGQIRIVYEE